ncbi:hypothetical protein EV200_101574 [Pedobacter psychrotolerans]|uniref:Uncharacterized protein n=1 Tax=Pedobacter psychrotolerans TaxID=1843235 RepID=A0A4V2S0C3_9SPHI|nr:hypothetical protein EV200_101574 [Pedobacter psychrotolerans]
MYYIRIAIFSIVFFLLVFATTYFSMRIFMYQPASSCLDCSYLKDTFFFSLFSLLIIPFVLLILDKAKISKTLFLLIISVVFLLIAFINNFNLFKDRVSSWSSYSTKDEIVATIAQSYLYMVTGCIVTLLIFYKMYGRDKP